MRLTKGNDICPNCGAAIIQTPGKRGKEYCDATCRTNFWQKEQRRLAKGDDAPPAKVVVKDLTKPTGKKVVSDPPAKSNKTINTLPDRAAGLRKIKGNK